MEETSVSGFALDLDFLMVATALLITVGADFTREWSFRNIASEISLRKFANVFLELTIIVSSLGLRSFAQFL